MTITTRPCRPGDVLHTATYDSGVSIKIAVAEPYPHPQSGTTDDHSVRLAGTLRVPAADHELDYPFRTPQPPVVLDQRLQWNWGVPVGECREVTIVADAPSISQAMDNLRKRLIPAAEAIEGIYMDHYVSRARQLAAREAAYAAFPVPAESAETTARPDTKPAFAVALTSARNGEKCQAVMRVDGEKVGSIDFREGELAVALVARMAVKWPLNNAIAE